jgi:hypothetical protein
MFEDALLILLLADVLLNSSLLITKPPCFGWSTVFCIPLKSNMSASATNALGFLATTGSSFGSTLTSSSPNCF